MRAEAKRSAHDAISKLEQEIAEKSNQAEALRRKANVIDDDVARLRRSYEAMRESFGLPRASIPAVRRRRKDSLSDEERVAREKLVMEPILALRGATLGEIARSVTGKLGYTSVAKIVKSLVTRGAVERHGQHPRGVSIYLVAAKPIKATAKPASGHYSLREEEIMKCAISVMATGMTYGTAELTRNLRCRILNLTEPELRVVLTKMVSDRRISQDEFQYRMTQPTQRHGGA